MNEKVVTDALRVVERKMLACLDKLNQKTRLGAIDDLIHCLQFERQFMLLTPEERMHMDGRLSLEAIQKIGSAKTEREREEFIQMYSRANYIRGLAWRDYLNGVTNEKPFSSARHKKVA